jgi:hypothetical protein
MLQSTYFAGPEGLSLEVCCGSAIDERQWIDPEVQALCGISAEEIERLKHPDPIPRTDEPIAQPAFDESKPRMHYPDEVYAFLMGMSDDDIWTSASVTTPPVPLPE